MHSDPLAGSPAVPAMHLHAETDVEARVDVVELVGQLEQVVNAIVFLYVPATHAEQPLARSVPEYPYVQRHCALVVEALAVFASMSVQSEHD